MATATLHSTFDGGATKYWTVVLDDLSQYGLQAADAPSAITAAQAIQAANAAAAANAATIQQRAAAAIATNVTYEGLGAPTAAQNTAQILALTKQSTAVIRDLLGLFSSLSGA